MSATECEHENVVADDLPEWGNWNHQGLQCIDCGLRICKVCMSLDRAVAELVD